MNEFFQRPTGKENLTSRGWYDKWYAYIYGDALAKRGVQYRNVFLDDFIKMKKKSKIKKNISNKTDNNPINISTIQGDSTPNNVVSKQIIVGDQLGMPEEAQYRITFADFRKQIREFSS
tara:strand:+ start:51 stop:407 length:357 start_codon:yes stop_codon:yes gene_type:complete